MSRKKGDVGSELLRKVRYLVQLAYRLKEECSSVSVSRTTTEGFTHAVPGFDSRAWDLQDDTHTASGTITDIIGKDYGPKTARKIHDVIRGKPTSSLSKQQYKDLLEIFCPAYFNVFLSEGLLNELWAVCSDIEEQGMGRVQRQQKETKEQMKRYLVGEADEKPPFEIEELFEGIEDSVGREMAHELFSRWLRNHKKMG